MIFNMPKRDLGQEILDGVREINAHKRGMLPLVGGQLLIFFGWRSIFLALSGFGILCLILVLWGLRESLPVERRTQAGLGAALRVYGALLADGRFMGYVLTAGLASGAMFAYISGSPFVFIELNGVPLFLAPMHLGVGFSTGFLACTGNVQEKIGDDTSSNGCPPR